MRQHDPDTPLAVVRSQAAGDAANPARHDVLRRAGPRLRSISQSLPLMLWAAAPDGARTYFDHRWLDFTGRTLERECGTGWASGVHVEDLEQCMHIYLNSLRRREPFRVEYRLRRADGVYRWVLESGMPRLAADGSFAGYVGSCIDITETKESPLRRLGA